MRETQAALQMASLELPRKEMLHGVEIRHEKVQVGSVRQSLSWMPRLEILANEFPHVCYIDKREEVICRIY